MKEISINNANLKGDQQKICKKKATLECENGQKSLKISIFMREIKKKIQGGMKFD